MLLSGTMQSGAGGGLGALLRPLLRRGSHGLLAILRHRREARAAEEARDAIGGDGALTELVRAYEMEPARVREWAENDSDLDSIRTDPRYPLEAA